VREGEFVKQGRHRVVVHQFDFQTLLQTFTVNNPRPSKYGSN